MSRMRWARQGQRKLQRSLLQAVPRQRRNLEQLTARCLEFRGSFRRAGEYSASGVELNKEEPNKTLHTNRRPALGFGLSVGLFDTALPDHVSVRAAVGELGRSVSFDAPGGFPEMHGGESGGLFRVGALLEADI